MFVFCKIVYQIVSRVTRGYLVKSCLFHTFRRICHWRPWPCVIWSYLGCYAHTHSVSHAVSNMWWQGCLLRSRQRPVIIWNADIFVMASLSHGLAINMVMWYSFRMYHFFRLIFCWSVGTVLFAFWLIFYRMSVHEWNGIA